MKRSHDYWVLFLLLSVSVLANAQTITQKAIRGTVTDEATGESLIGVSIYAPHSNVGRISDVQGEFVINLSPKDSVLKFSLVGYVTKFVKIGNQKELKVRLSENTKDLNEVVVVGYGTQKKSDVTGSVSVVDLKEINKRPVASVAQALQGQVAGVDVAATSGSPGSPVTVRIRGIGTLNDANPLYVVDGMLLDDIDFLNAQDIETMQVLKDASASAIYGSRGSNGVVIITTKHGDKNAGNAKITVSGYYGIQNSWRSSNMMDGPTWGALRNESVAAAGNTPIITDPSKLTTTNWFHEISNSNAPVYDFNVSAIGGNAKGDYLLSFNSFKQDGIIKKTDLGKMTFRSNASYELKPYLRVGENLTFVKSNQQVQYENDEWTSMMVTSFMRDPATPVKNADGTYTRGMFDVWNPVAEIEYNNSTNEAYRTIGNVYADLTLWKGLVLKSNYSLEYCFAEGEDYVPVYYVFNVQRNDISKLTKSQSSYFVNQWSNTLSFDRTFGNHTVSALLGVETYRTLSKWTGMTATGFLNDDKSIRYFDNALNKSQAAVSGSMTEVRQVSGLARLNYSYKDKYLFTSNFRVDASSKFVGDLRRAYFPSFTLGWRLNEEQFMKDIKSINNLKLRAGWGQIGNQGSVPAYQYATLASPDANYAWGNTINSGYAFPGMGNSKLKWETSTTTNFALDFGFFNNKLTGSVEYFAKKTTDMILSVPVPGQTGIQNAPYKNAGSMKNNGLELTVQYTNNDHPLNYSIGFNFSKINNEVTNLGAEGATISGASFANSFYATRTAVGYPIAQFYGYKTDGLFQNQAEINAQTAQKNVSPGDVRYVDADKDGNLDFYYLGSPLPKFSYAFNLSLGYKGFDLSVMLQGVYGDKIFNGVATYTRSSTVNYNLSKDMINRWRGEDTQTDARYPRLATNDVNNALFSDRFIEDGSYLRVKTVQLGYTIDRKLLKSLKVDNLRVYVSALNLFTFTKYTGMDPEVGMHNDNPLDVNVDRGTYPQARTLNAGLSLTF